MRFKKLELIGFKSFSEKTAIEFEAGVTAVVGPNGCGKSNIADAIRWVLGEQSAKSLRGSSMEDVIFSGSAYKDPVNLAEVSLTLSNELKALPIDYDEVTITRRLYRSGESEYLLNKNIVRLRDIHELFMGTGIGTESYSIIEQGKMDQLLNSKPEERRVIFEEAAGITKFKSKKKEALRKLEQTDVNLTRINDIIQEVKRQIGSIERQAKKAESYRVEFEKMKSLELAVASREFLTFDDARLEKERGLENLKQKERQAGEAARTIENQCSQMRETLMGLDASLRQGDAEELSIASDIRKSQDRILLNRERMGELVERRESLLRQCESTRKRIEQFKSELHALDTALVAAEKEEVEGRRFLDTVETEFKSLDDFIRGAVAEAAEARSRLAALATEKSALQDESAKAQAESAVISGRLKKLQEDEVATAVEWKRLKADLEKTGAEMRSLELKLNQPLAARISEFKDKLFGFVRGLLGSGRSSLEPQDESHLESEIRSFAESVRAVHSEFGDQRGRLRSMEDMARKAETDLSRVRNEMAGLAAEEARLGQRAREYQEKMSGFAAREYALLEAQEQAEKRSRERSSEREALLVRLAETRSQQTHLTARRDKTSKDRQWILDSEKTQEEVLASSEGEAKESVSRKESLEKENRALEEGGAVLTQKRDTSLRQNEGKRREREEVVARLAGLEKERHEKEVFLREASEAAHAIEMQGAELRHSMDRLKERIFNVYQVDLIVQRDIAETEKAMGDSVAAGELDLEQAKQDIQALRDKLQKMGPVNLVAIEEHAEMKQRFDFLSQQQADLVKAKEDLHKTILKINRTTKELFVETFAKIQKNFTEYYRLLFGGGTAQLVLLDENDVLESGIEIVARPPGKKLQNISLLSGGEKALTAIALLFALFKVKPSPFCVLDEIDAPLDEANVDRFCRVLKEFISQSQFILITHNKRTMNLADCLYGITMAENGISRVVSVKLEGKAQLNERKEEALAL